jgi:hypothetical protein
VRKNTIKWAGPSTSHGCVAPTRCRPAWCIGAPLLRRLWDTSSKPKTKQTLSRPPPLPSPPRRRPHSRLRRNGVARPRPRS